MMHEDEFEIDLPLVRTLVDRTLPELANNPLEPLRVSGSSNALFRLGEDFLVRLPRQPGGSETILKETRWLPSVATALSVDVPALVAVGEPDPDYPEHWSVVRWIDGETPSGPNATADRSDGFNNAFTRDLADTIGSLRHLDVPVDALSDPSLHSYRSDPLAAMDETIRAYVEDCRKLTDLDLDLDACLQVWETTLDSCGAQEAVEPRWLHGDLFAENLLIRNGWLSAVLDFGNLSVGDPTVDLAVAWELLDPIERDVFRSALAVDDVTWSRGRGWALAIALMTFPYYWQTMPDRCAARRVMAQAVLADAAWPAGEQR